MSSAVASLQPSPVRGQNRIQEHSSGMDWIIEDLKEGNVPSFSSFTVKTEKIGEIPKLGAQIKEKFHAAVTDLGIPANKLAETLEGLHNDVRDMGLAEALQHHGATDGNLAEKAGAGKSKSTRMAGK
jgi:hypothetical protein